MLLPWLALLALLCLRMNHSAHAWVAVIPYAIVTLLQALSGLLPQVISSTSFEIVSAMVKITVFSLAVAWLIMPWLRASHRFVAFLKLLGGLLCAAALAFICEKTIGGFELGEAFSVSISAGLLCIATALALFLAGLNCRKRFGWGRLISWAAIWSIAMAVATLALILGISILADSSPDAAEFLIAVAACSAMVAGPLLSYLVVSALNKFHGERLRSWLCGGSEAEPPMLKREPAAAGSEGML